MPRKKTTTIVEKIKEMFSDYEGKVAIFTHRNPDPDCIGSAVGIQWMLQRFFEIDSDIFHEGEISHIQNKTMVNVLEIRLQNASEYNPEKYEKTIIVDATTANTPLEKTDIVIDHHRANDNNTTISCIEQVGSASTIVTEIIQSMGLEFVDDVEQRISTSLFFGIRNDTDDLVSETTTDRDYKASEFLSKSLDRRKLAQVVRYPLPIYYFESKKTLNKEGNYFSENAYFVGSIGITSPSRRDALPMLADEMVRMEGVETSIIFAVIGNHLDVCVRSENTSLDVNNFCQKLFGKENAGGKYGKGAAHLPLGILGCDNLPEEKKEKYWDAMKDMLFHKILHIAAGN